MSDDVDRRETAPPIGGVIGLLMGNSVLITGVEDDPEDGLLRVYIGPRYEWRYVLVSDPAEQEKVRRAWDYGGGHLTTARPDHYYVDDDALAAIKARREADHFGSREAPDGR